MRSKCQVHTDVYRKMIYRFLYKEQFFFLLPSQTLGQRTIHLKGSAAMWQGKTELFNNPHQWSTMLKCQFCHREQQTYPEPSCR